MDRTAPRLFRFPGIGRDRTATFACGASAILLGLIGMSAWMFDNEFLRRELVDYTTINPATSIALMSAGGSILLAGAGRSRLALAAAAFVAAIAAAKGFDLVFGGLPIDRLLFTDLLDSALVPRPSRMAPNTAAATFTAGLALCLLQLRPRPAKVIAQLMAMWVLLMGIFVLVGYASNLTFFNNIGTYLPMAKTTAMGLIALGLGALSLSRDVGIVLVIRDRGPASTMCRITLPPLIFIPLGVGVARMWGEQQGLYSPQAGIAMQIMSNVVISSSLLMVCALALHRSDLARRDREVELRNSEQFNRLVASANPDCISLLDDDFVVLFANEALMRAHGFEDYSALVGHPYGYRLDADAQAERDAALASARSGGAGRFTLRYGDPYDGEGRWFDTIVTKLPADHDWPFRYLAISRDISEKREIEDQVRWKAAHDDLTTLPNRAQFQAHLDRRVGRVRDEGFALLMLDIDNFKMVNDTLGHDAGDLLLRTVAERLMGAVREGDVVARLAGDEFAVIAPGIRTETAVMGIAERIFEALREPWIYQGRPGECRVSIGASLAPRHGDAADELLKHADIALYEAKTRGKGQMAVYRASMKSAVERRSRQVSLARRALSDDLIAPYYQPKIELATGGIAGFEALLRWRHPTAGMQMPATIQAAFEDMELGSEITERMVDRVLVDMSRWRARELRFGHVAINVTAADLKRDAFSERLLEKLAARGLPHDCLQVEVTETVFMGRGAEYVERALWMLHDAGIRIALDDFGTGYASLSHLKQFPVDIVKIDRSFLHDFALDPQNQAIINTVISLGHSLDIDIVAEGIETREQERHLLMRGCTYGQGYLYGKAASAVRVPGLLTRVPRELRKAA